MFRAEDNIKKYRFFKFFISVCCVGMFNVVILQLKFHLFSTMQKIIIYIYYFFHFSNFTAQSSSLTSLASTLSEGLNEATKRSPNNDTKFGSVLSVTDLEVNFNNVSARLQSWPANPKSEWQKNLPVVVFRRAKKSYGSGKSRKTVLDMLNMTIKEGSM